MMLLAYLKKTFLESLRDWKVLGFVLVFAPAFVYLMHGYFSAADPSYRVVVAKHADPVGAAAPAQAIEGLLAAWKRARRPDGAPVFELTEIEVSRCSDLDAAKAKVRAREADLLVEVPADFAKALENYRRRENPAPASLVNYADDRNLRSSMAMAMSDYVTYLYAAEFTGATLPLEVSMRSLAGNQAQTEFDLYVPALLVFGIILTLFTAMASLIREIDKGTMIRLRLSRLTTTQLVTAVAINQVPLGFAAVLLTYLAAMSCGYRSAGSVGALLLAATFAILGVVAIAVMSAAFLKSMFELLTIGTLPFFVLMFFSECMFPLPRIRLLEIAGNTLYANDVLPTTPCVRAFNKILNHGATLRDVVFELGVTAVLTVIYGALGLGLFRYRHRRI